MSSPQVLRIPKKDGSGHLLVHIVPREQHSLNLTLIGTDTDILFECVLKDSKVKELQSSKFSGSLQEWKTVLAFVLLHEQPEGPLPEYLKGVEIVAEIAESTFTIMIRKIVGAITQTLGSVALKEKVVEVELFDWIHAAAASSDRLREQLQTSQTTSTEQQEQIASLTAELDQLVKAKKEHEQELLAKFATLLNEKKLKIRDQQRLLSHAQVEPDVAQDVLNERSKDPASRKTGISRSKRKARDEENEKALTEDEQGTPTDSDVATADEDEDEDEDTGSFAPAPAASQVSNRRSAASQSQSQAAQRMDVDDETLPPARQLPFSKPRAAEPTPKKNSSTQQPAEEADEETDDEL